MASNDLSVVADRIRIIRILLNDLSRYTRTNFDPVRAITILRNIQNELFDIERMVNHEV